MSKEVKRYELRIVDRYAGDGTGDIETDARMKQEAKGRYVLFSDYEALLAERDVLNELLRVVYPQLCARRDEQDLDDAKQYVLAEECQELIDGIDAAMQGEQP